jgi:hypothetical protein
MAAPTKYEVFIDGAKDSSPAGRERLAQALASNYGLPLEQAKRVVAGGHFRVKRDVELQMARRYVSHLEGLGARASLAECGPRAATTSSPDLRAAVRAAGIAPAAPKAAAPAAPKAAAPAPVAPKAAAPAPVAPKAAAPAPAAPPPSAAPAAAVLNAPTAAAADAVPDEFGISISGLLADAAAPAAPAAAPVAPPPPALAAPPPAAPAPVALPAAPPAARPAPAAAPAVRPAPAAAAPAAPAAPPPPNTPTADAGGFSVVTLDGEGDGALELERGDAGSAGGGSAFAPPDGGDEFLPPDERDGVLELVHDAPKAKPKASVTAPIPELYAPIEEVPLSDEKLSASSQSFALDEAPPPPGSQVKAAPPPPTPAPLPMPARPAATAPRPAVAPSASRAAPEGGLLGGRIRQSLAARVLLGVVMSVALSFLPAGLYASHAHSTAIRALQLEERELAEKPPAATAAPARTSAQVREEIGSARTRAFVVTLFIWVTLAAVLGFLWYRFV